MPLVLQILTISAFVLSAIYIILIFFFYLGFRKLKSHELKEDKDLPDLTVIVCAKDEEEHIEKTINSILVQDYPKNKYSIIAVNDRSDDKTPDLLNALASKNDNMKVIHISDSPADVSPKKNAIAQAIKLCETDFVVATDADAVHQKLWLRSYGSLCEDKLGAATAVSLFSKEKFDNSFEETWQSMQTLENLSHNVIIAGAMANNIAIAANGSNMLYRKDLFNKASSRKNIVSGDDSDIIFEAERQGYQLKFNSHPEALVKLVPEDSIRGVINQRMRWASKTLKSSFSVIFLGLSVFFFYLSILILPFFAFVDPKVLIYWAGIVFIKAICDFFYMTVSLKKFQVVYKFKHLFLMELVHAPFIVWVGLRGTFGKFTWKGSTYKKTL